VEIGDDVCILTDMKGLAYLFKMVILGNSRDFLACYYSRVFSLNCTPADFLNRLDAQC
jgi:hypothetical protein